MQPQRFTQPLRPRRFCRPYRMGKRAKGEKPCGAAKLSRSAGRFQVILGFARFVSGSIWRRRQSAGRGRRWRMHMQPDLFRRRVLVAAGAPALFSLRNLFVHEPLQGWEAIEADSFAQARFIMQHHPCDVVLVNEDLFQRERNQGLSWLMQAHEAPLIVLAGDTAQMVAQAYEQ